MNSRFQAIPRRHLVSFRRRPDLGFARGSGLSSVAARFVGARAVLRSRFRAARRPPTGRSVVARSVLHSRLLLRAPSPDRAVGVAPSASASRRRRRTVGVIAPVHRPCRRSRPCSSPCRSGTDRPATAGGLDRHYTGTEQATEVRTSHFTVKVCLDSNTKVQCQHNRKPTGPTKRVTQGHKMFCHTGDLRT